MKSAILRLISLEIGRSAQTARYQQPVEVRELLQALAVLERLGQEPLDVDLDVVHNRCSFSRCIPTPVTIVSSRNPFVIRKCSNPETEIGQLEGTALRPVR